MVSLVGLCTPWQSMSRNSGSLQFCVSILRNDSPLTHWPCGVTSSMLIPVCAVRVTRASNETDSMSQSFFCLCMRWGNFISFLFLMWLRSNWYQIIIFPQLLEVWIVLCLCVCLFTRSICNTGVVVAQTPTSITYSHEAECDFIPGGWFWSSRNSPESLRHLKENLFFFIFSIVCFEYSWF